MEKRLTDKQIKWQKVTFSDWYGARNKTIPMTNGTAIWDRDNDIRVTLKRMLVEGP